MTNPRTKFEVSSASSFRICSIVCQKFQVSHDLSHALLGKSYLCTRSAFHTWNYAPSLKSLSQVVLKICSIVCQIFQESGDLCHAPLGENYLCTRSAFPRRTYVPNLKSLAQVFLKICAVVCQKFKGSRDLSHALLGEVIYDPGRYSKYEAITKFEVSSSSSFEDMFDRMPKILGVMWPRPRPFCKNFANFYSSLPRSSSVTSTKCLRSITLVLPPL